MAKILKFVMDDTLQLEASGRSFMVLIGGS